MKMRMVFAAALILAPLAAQAADLPRPPYKTPIVPIEPAFSWSGLYVGINGGYMWGSSQWTGGAGNFELSPNGWLAGGTLGYNFQAGSWVLGVEGDIDYANLKGTANSTLCSGCTFKDTWLGTLRGRVGYAYGQWLPYLTAGGAWGNVYVANASGSQTSTKGGWTAGGGVEYSWGGPWSAKLEYLYVDLGDATCGTATCFISSSATVHFTSNIVRAGVNYRF